MRGDSSAGRLSKPAHLWRRFSFSRVRGRRLGQFKKNTRFSQDHGRRLSGMHLGRPPCDCVRLSQARRPHSASSHFSALIAEVARLSQPHGRLTGYIMKAALLGLRAANAKDSLPPCGQRRGRASLLTRPCRADRSAAATSGSPAPLGFPRGRSRRREPRPAAARCTSPAATPWRIRRASASAPVRRH